MPVSYLIHTNTSHMDVEAILDILNIAGKGQAFHGSSKGVVSTNLWIIPKGKRNKQEVTAMLQAIPSIHSVSVVALSNPIKEQELVEVRQLFAQVGLDASNVTNDALLLFLNAKLQGQYTYFIDYENMGNAPVKIQVKPIEKHPHFSPDWLKESDHAKEEILDRVYTIDDIKISSVALSKIEEIEPPPPPPPPPSNKHK